jgi:hypothetical protein
LIAQSLWIDIPRRIRRAAHSSLHCPAGTPREKSSRSHRNQFCAGARSKSSREIGRTAAYTLCIFGPLIPEFLRSHVSGVARLCGAEISSSFRGRPNRKWPTHAHWSLRRRWSLRCRNCIVIWQFLHHCFPKASGPQSICSCPDQHLRMSMSLSVRKALRILGC